MATRNKRITKVAARELQKRGKRKLAAATAKLGVRGSEDWANLSTGMEESDNIVSYVKKMKQHMSKVDVQETPQEIVHDLNVLPAYFADMLTKLMQASHAASAGRDQAAAKLLKAIRKTLRISLD